MAESRPARISPWRIVLDEVETRGFRSGIRVWAAFNLAYNLALYPDHAQTLAILLPPTRAEFWLELEKQYREAQHG